MTIRMEIRHPEWLEKNSPLQATEIGNTLRMYQDGKLPPSIAGWMIVVACMRPLRAVYGSNLRAGLAIGRDALAEKFTAFRYRLGLLTPAERKMEREINEMEDERFWEALVDVLRSNASSGIKEPRRNPQASTGKPS